MFRKDNRRRIWFGAFVAGGIVLGLILLAQTVSTYVYVGNYKDWLTPMPAQ